MFYPSLLWPHFTHGKYDFNKLESTQPKYAFKQVYWHNLFLANCFKDIFLSKILPAQTPPPLLLLNSTPRDQDLNKFGIPRDAFLYFHVLFLLPIG